MKTIQTGSADPYFYMNQLDQAGRAMTMFVMARRQREEQERERRRERAQQLYDAVQSGAVRPDDMRLEAAYSRLAELDPQAASDLRLQTKGLFDRDAAISDFHNYVLASKKGYDAAVMTQALQRMNPYLRAQVMKSAGITPAMLTPKDPDEVPIPKTFEEAIAQGIAGAREMGEAQAIGAIHLGREAAKRKQEEEEELTKRGEDLQMHEEKAKINAKYRAPRVGRAAKKEEPPAPHIDPSALGTAQRAYFDDLAKAEPPRGGRPHSRIAAEARLRALADAVASSGHPLAAQFADAIRANLQTRTKLGEEEQELREVEAELARIGILSPKK